MPAGGIYNCSVAGCCKIDTCLGNISKNCGINVAGAKNLQIAVLCAIDDYTLESMPGCAVDGNPEVGTDQFATTYVTGVVMNHPDTAGDMEATDGTSWATGTGCDENLFYCVASESETLDVQYTWTTDPDTGNTTFNYTISGKLFTQSANAITAIEQYQGKEIVARFEEAGTNEWVIIGLEGGIYWETTEGLYGAALQDEKSITYTITGDSTGRHHYVKIFTDNSLPGGTYDPAEDPDGTGWDNTNEACQFEEDYSELELFLEVTSSGCSSVTETC